MSRKIQKLTKIIDMMHEYRTTYPGNPFHNNKWREIFQESLLNVVYKSGFELYPAGTGPDIKNDRLGIKNGELKGAETKTQSLSDKEGMRWGLDKMNDPIKQDSVYDVEFWCFSAFRGSKIFVSFIIPHDNENGRLRLHNLFKEKIDALDALIEQCEAENRRLPRDDIAISLSEMLTFQDDEVVVIINNKIESMTDYKHLVNQKLLYSDAIKDNVMEYSTAQDRHNDSVFNQDENT